MKITAAEVNKLRQMTGAGMMDCKKALQETEGDFDAAIDFLRKKGQKVAAKRADRDANEGIVIAGTNDDNTFGAVILVGCETDFVGKNEEFIQFAKDLLAKGIDGKITTKDELMKQTIGNLSVEEKLSELLGKTGEKMQIAEYETIEAPYVCAYNHHGNRLATLVGFSKSGIEGLKEVGHDVAMQIAAMNPIAVDKESVDQKTIDHEMEIGKEQALQEGKPENLVEKIAFGKLNKFFKENTLVAQEFIKDSKKTVEQVIKEIDKELKVTGFKRIKLGD
jgi:elongation factor Ts